MQLTIFGCFEALIDNEVHWLLANAVLLDDNRVSVSTSYVVKTLPDALVKERVVGRHSHQLRGAQSPSFDVNEVTIWLTTLHRSAWRYGGHQVRGIERCFKRLSPTP